MTLARFGSIFKFKDEYFVLLGQTAESDTLYSAKILNLEESGLLMKMKERADKSKAPYRESLHLLFVILTCDDFKGRAASLGGTDAHATPYSPVQYTDKSLSAEDLTQLKELILNDEGLPQKLRDLIKKDES
jgi:hypothetical protein